MKNFKRLICAALALTSAVALCACGTQTTTDDGSTAENKDVPIIGISQYGQHGSLDNCRTGFL